MCLMYHLLFINRHANIDISICNDIENIILQKYPYKETIELNRRDTNIVLFKQYITKISLKRSEFLQLIPYILNINYSLKNFLESYL